MNIQTKQTALLLVLISVTGLANINETWATTRSDKAQYGRTTSPYWVIGTPDRHLSRACQRREFSQKRQLRYTIAFVGNKGRALTGIATANWNLFDPKGLAKPLKTYHFYNDGLSNCEVYVSPQPLK